MGRLSRVGASVGVFTCNLWRDEVCTAVPAGYGAAVSAVAVWGVAVSVVLGLSVS